MAAMAIVSDAMFHALGPMTAAPNGAMWLLTQWFFHMVWKRAGAIGSGCGEHDDLLIAVALACWAARLGSRNDALL